MSDFAAHLLNQLQLQKTALADGKQAEREGQRVIYIHGQPYADPADDPDDEAPGSLDGQRTNPEASADHRPALAGPMTATSAANG